MGKAGVNIAIPRNCEWRCLRPVLHFGDRDIKSPPMPNSPAHPYIYLSVEQRKRCERWLDELLDMEVASESRIERIRLSVRRGRIRSMDMWRLERAGENRGVAAFTT